MKVRDLIDDWERSASEPLTPEHYSLRLPMRDAARVKALAQMYPRRNVEELLRELLSAALDEVEESMPYEQGIRVIAEDEQGDPIYEDAGPAARFRALAERFTSTMLGERSEQD